MANTWLPYITAFTVGLVGGVHCLGMCGGIVGALSYQLPGPRSNGRQLLYQLAYNLGRISSYVAAGALMGGLGVLLVSWLPLQTAQKILLFIAGLFMILLGCYLTGWWMALNRVEAAGRLLWKRIEPIGKRLLPPTSPYHAFGLGLVWGWLPCGLVYSMLIQAVSSGGVASGAAIMLAFALGTLPNLILLGMLAGAAARLIRSLWAKRIAGITVIGFGIVTLLRLV